MNRPGFPEGLGVALVAGIAGGVLHGALGPLLGSGGALRLLVALSGFAYVVYLLCRSPARCGRLTTLAAWCAVAAITAALSPPLPIHLLIHLGLVWLIRALYFQHGLLAALADLGLVAFGLATTVWALLHAGSLFLAFWCFFLVQALFTAIPAGGKRQAFETQSAAADRFHHAQRAAEAALRRLSSTP